jgi:hypothetical protein
MVDNVLDKRRFRLNKLTLDLTNLENMLISMAFACARKKREKKRTKKKERSQLANPAIFQTATTASYTNITIRANFLLLFFSLF